MSTFTPKLGLPLQDTGENPNVWGDVFNTVIDLIDDAIAGSVSVDISSGSEAVTSQDGEANQARAMCLRVIGTPSGAAELTVPVRQKVYVIRNDCGQQLTVKPLGGTSVVLAVGAKKFVVIDELLNTAYILKSSGTVVPNADADFTEISLSVTNGSPTTASAFYMQEGTQFSIGFEDLNPTISDTSFVLTSDDLPTAPSISQGAHCLIDDNGTIYDAFAVFTTGQIAFSRADGGAWGAAQARQLVQTWLNFNMARA